MADEVILNKAAVIERCLTRIAEEYDGNEDALFTDFTRQDAIVLNLQRACEASIDLAMHATRKRQLGLPQDARDAFTLLERAHVLPHAIADRMRAMVGFRNIAVHQYQDLDLQVLRAILDHRLQDFLAFVRAVSGVGASDGP